MKRSSACGASLRWGRCGVLIMQSATPMVMMVFPASSEKFGAHSTPATWSAWWWVSTMPRACERALELGELLGEIRFGLVRAEGVVRRLVQSRIDHHRAVRIDDLEGRARHRHRCVVAALDHEFARTNARCNAHAVDHERKRAGQDRAHRSNGREVGTEIHGVTSLGGRGLGHVQQHCARSGVLASLRRNGSRASEGAAPAAELENYSAATLCAADTPRAFTTTLIAS